MIDVNRDILENPSENGPFYRELFERTREAIVISGSNSVIFDANPAAARLFGFTSPEELLNKFTVSLYAYPENRALLLKELKESSYFEDHEVEFIRQDGTHFIALVSAIQVKDEQGELVRTEAFLTDISERKNMEKALVESQSYLNAIYQSSTIGLAIGDLSGKFVKINPAIEHILGYTLEELRNLTMQDITHPDDFIMDMKHFEEVLNGRKPRYQLEKRFIHKNGSLIWGLTNVTLVRNAEGIAEFAVGTIEDITERKQAESALVESETRFRNLAMHVENIRENERAKMASDLHDDLGQMLTALNMDVSWLKCRLKGESTEISEKLSSVSSTILDSINRIHTLSAELRPGILNDLGITAALEWQLEEFRKRNHANYSFKYKPDDLVLSQELSVQIFRIVQEALTNIARHSEATQISLELIQDKESVVINLKDNGKGISNEEIQNPRSYGIIGMRERVRTLGGKFSISGTKGKGTKLVIDIPQIKLP